MYGSSGRSQSVNGETGYHLLNSVSCRTLPGFASWPGGARWILAGLDITFCTLWATTWRQASASGQLAARGRHPRWDITFCTLSAAGAARLQMAARGSLAGLDITFCSLSTLWADAASYTGSGWLGSDGSHGTAAILMRRHCSVC